jgi:DNA-binding MarR family transcriptional regulator
MVPTTSAPIEALAADLDAHWLQVGRFFLSRKLRSELHRGRAAELSPVQLHAIAMLNEGPIRLRDLADRLGVAESTATRLVDRLASADLVARHPSPTDRRAVLIGLTPTGRRIASSIARDRRAWLTELLELLEPDERVEFVHLFGKLASTSGVHAAAGKASA